MTQPQSIITFQDAIERLMDYTGSNAGQSHVRAIKQSIIEAYDELVNARNWRYLYRSYRLYTIGPATGTLAYSSSTGIYTIDSGTFAAGYATGSALQINSIWYPIKARVSSTTLLADDQIRPQADIDTGTAFTIAKFNYTLPDDFRALHRPKDESTGFWSYYVQPDAWSMLQRYGSGSGSPFAWTVMGDQNSPGRNGLYVYPYFPDAHTYDFMYQRFPRFIKYDGYQSICRDGTLDFSGTATAAGTSTSWKSDMGGSILRASYTAASAAPEGIGGTNPYEYQEFISSRNTVSATSLVLDNATTIASGSRYFTITDYIDIDRGMHDAFWRCCEKHLAQKLNLPTLNTAVAAFESAYLKARSADSKSLAGRSSWDYITSYPIKWGSQGPDDWMP